MIGNEFERLRRQILINQGAVGEPSYLVLTDSTRIDFEIENTPIVNFCTSGFATSNVTINGQRVVKNTIKEIVFGKSYEGVTSIPRYGLYNYTSLTLVDFSSLKSVTSIERDFLYYSNSLVSLRVGNIPASIIVATNSFINTPNSSSSIIYADTLTIGNGYKSRFSGLSNWTVVVN